MGKTRGVTRLVQRLGRLMFAAGVAGWALTTLATSQGPVADGPYVGTLPCSDCAGVRAVLTLYAMGSGGQPLAYRMTVTYLGTRDADRSEERLGPWSRLNEGTPQRIRIEPFDETLRQTFMRVDADTLALLDRDERPIVTGDDFRLVRQTTTPNVRPDVPRTLFRGMLARDGERLMFTPCGQGKTVRVHDVSPEVVITAALTDIGFDRLGQMYLEVYGRVRDGALMIDRLNRAGTEMGCPKAPFGMRAQGNEPGWQLDSGPKGVILTRQDGTRLNAPPIPLSWRWSQGRPDRPEATLTFATESAQLRAVLTPKICRDTMADAVYGLTARVQVTRPSPPMTFSGCAFLGSEALP